MANPFLNKLLNINRKLVLYFYYFISLKYKIFLKNYSNRFLVRKPIVFSASFISVGKNVSFLHYCRVEGVSSYNGELFKPHLKIGDNVTFEQSCHISFASNLIIGNNTTLSSFCFVTDIDHTFVKNVKATHTHIKVNKTFIGENCFIGTGAKILAGTKLGDNCIVGANAVVKGVFEPGSTIGGVPARKL